MSSACWWSASARRVPSAASSTARPCVAAFGAIAKTGASDAVSYLGEAIAAPDAYYDARLAAEAFGAALYRVPAIRSTRKPPEPALKAFGFAVADASQKAPAQRGLADTAWRSPPARR